MTNRDSARAEAAEIEGCFGDMVKSFDRLLKNEAATEETLTDLAASLLDAADNVGHAFNELYSDLAGEVSIDWIGTGVSGLRRRYASATGFGIEWKRAQ